MLEFDKIVSRIEAGTTMASDELLPLVYDELRKLAAAKLAHENPGHTLQPTALVHEAYLRLTSDSNDAKWESRRHFFAAAAEAMRRILVDRARQKATIRYGGQLRRLELTDDVTVDDGRAAELLALDDAIAELENHDSQAAQLVKLRYFAGLGHQDAAEIMKVSRRTADRLWLVAKAWLYKRLERE